MNNQVKNYYSPTPKKWRKLGDSILLLGTTLTATFAGMEVEKGWIIGAAITTAFGKMVTNFFSDDDSPRQKEEAPV